VTRSYLVSGEIFTTEEDKDGDGFFETMIVFDPSKKELEVFLPQKDGSTVVAPAAVKASYQKIFRAVDEFNRIWEAPVHEKTFEKVMIETKEGIDSAGEGIRKQQSLSGSENERLQKPQ